MYCIYVCKYISFVEYFYVTHTPRYVIKYFVVGVQHTLRRLAAMQGLAKYTYIFMYIYFLAFCSSTIVHQILFQSFTAFYTLYPSVTELLNFYGWSKKQFAVVRIKRSRACKMSRRQIIDSAVLSVSGRGGLECSEEHIKIMFWGVIC